MSDHSPKKTKRTLKRIRICGDDYLNVFDLLPSKKVGLEVAAVSDRFDALVDTHFKTRKWTLGALQIYSDKIVKRNADGTEETLPFPQIPLPNSVVGFARLVVCSFNSDAIAFLNSIGRLWQSNISLQFPSFYGGTKWDCFASSVFPLLNLSAIIQIFFENTYDFHYFRRLSSPTVLCDCANLRIITLFGHRLLQFPPDDSAGSSDGQALCQWLHTPRADGQLKMLQNYSANEFPMDELKTHFLSATTAVNFILCLRYFSAVPFELINSVTREQMKCRQIANSWTIVRCPIDRNEKQWAEWEKEIVEYRYGTDWKVINIRV